MFVGIVPAKLESRRIERKNVKILGGLPLLVYTLRAALHAGSLHRVVVSTDSDIVEDLALRHSEGRLDVLRRATHLATETTTAEAVLLDAADRLQEFLPDGGMLPGDIHVRHLNRAGLGFSVRHCRLTFFPTVRKGAR